MNEDLCQPYSEDEVIKALHDMSPSAAPGPDGMPPIFFQKYWHVVGASVTAAVLQALNSGAFHPDLNHTYISLIPKKHCPTVVADYRPISLCNVTYKLISKAISNRLKAVLPGIIGESQSAFVPGRLITDNVLIAYELMHFLKHKKKGKQGYMSLKLDMSKAYDRVEWCFLKQVMEQMGFAAKFISLVLYCISSVSFSVLIDGEPKGPIHPSRGLRQGDPLSPYLFLICTEGLIALLNSAGQRKEISGIKICRRAPNINHILFADDSVIFCKAEVEENQRAQSLLDLYERVSGQKINKEKTAMVFSCNVPQELREELRVLWGNGEILQYEQYLGLPSIVGRSKARAFQSIKQKVWQKLQSWKEKLLSQGGKEVLLKAVALAIPTYSMSCFLLPSSLCSELEGLMAKFWWGQKKDERRIHWISWGKMCEPKSRGGLGFKNLRIFNIALLAKQGWRLMQSESSVLHKLLKARYFSQSSFMESSLGNCPSFTWRGIWEAKIWLHRGCRWRMGDGKQVKLWTDQWLPGYKPLAQELRMHLYDSEETVSSVIDETTGWWDVTKLRSLFNPNLVAEIMKVTTPQRGSEDKLIWGHDRSGIFSVRSCYKLIKSHNEPDMPESSLAGNQKKLWKALWKMPVPNKIKIFGWRACKDCLPTKVNLTKKNVQIDPSCTFCQHPEEDLLHAVFSCPQICETWSQLLPSLAPRSPPAIPDLISQIIDSKDLNTVATFFCLAWGFWYRRNKWEFDKVKLSPRQVSNHALGLIQNITSPTGKTHGQSRDYLSWKAPPAGTLKLNTDGAIFPDFHKAGVGAILRDNTGKVLLAASKVEIEVEDPEEIELMAIFRGLQLCSTMGIHQLHVESDCLLVIQALQQNSMMSSMLGNLYSEVQRLTRCFACVSFSHVYREGNTVAHKLARYAWRVENIDMWWDTIPDFLSQALWLDKCL